jgi:hypothetical protein
MEMVGQEYVEINTLAFPCRRGRAAIMTGPHMLDRANLKPRLEAPLPDRCVAGAAAQDDVRPRRKSSLSSSATTRSKQTEACSAEKHEAARLRHMLRRNQVIDHIVHHEVSGARREHPNFIHRSRVPRLEETGMHAWGQFARCELQGAVEIKLEAQQRRLRVQGV